MLRIPIPFTGWATPYIKEGRRIIGLSWSFLGILSEIKHREDSDWTLGHWDVKSISLHWRWNWGEDHFYYDGPHCFYNFGPITIEWPNWECEKCHCP